MQKTIILLTLLLSSFLVKAQRNYAVGVIDSKTAKPVVGASIKILSSGLVSTTSASGNVVMFISPDDSLMITAKGYKDRKLLMANQSIALSIILDPVSKQPAAVKPRKKQVQKKS